MVGADSVFIKGHLCLRIPENPIEFLYQDLSVAGVSGLPNTPGLKKYFGQTLEATLQIPSPQKTLSFNIKAKVLLEKTTLSEHIALHFQLTEADHAALLAQISANGFHPTSYVRKYPRIPSNQLIQTFPLRAQLTSQSEKIPAVQLTTDVVNLSPNGVLISTENQQALTLMPGDRIHLTLEPRGWFPVPIEAEGLICRLTEDLHPQSQNLTRLFGIKFTRMDSANKTAFLDLLKDILQQLKQLKT